MKNLPHLVPSTTFSGRPGPLLLIIMDGVGLGKHDDSNAVFLAKTPFLDSLKTHPLYTKLKAHGKAVGMPTDLDMGNSEVGHNALGAGRVFDQGASLVQKAFDSKSIFHGSTWKKVIQNCIEKQSVLHFIGLLSDGNVHSHINHLKSMINQAVQENIKTIRCHILLDGRDVPNETALDYVSQIDSLSEMLQEKADIKIASGGGRMITTMDRYDADWSIVERGWNAHVLGDADPFNCVKDAIDNAYENKISDQFIRPFVIVENNKPIGPINDGDSVIFTNFRGDRSVEIAQAFEDADFNHFNRTRRPDVCFAGMMQYDGDLNIPKQYLVNPPQISNPISHYLCGTKIPSFAISETQKYGHVTYFWNGNCSDYIDKNLETYVEIPSDKCPIEEKPEMKAFEITDKTIELLQSNQFKFGRVNFPNGDMVGHTGDIPAVIKSVEVTDNCVERLVKAVNDLNGITIILADHGNADEMYTIKNNKKIIKTAHSLNLVPFWIIDADYQQEYIINQNIHGGLSNVASTICHLLGYNPPPDYNSSLILFDH
ncbi:2,3-bisphosphoglycerate-independent phosphoglycerate mutase [Candidatus Marinamargulisbacteria bacterium SCGC AG-410-N11]|nr:2,3-bisphosphoglycerate-independent phosphoglycerate mutase [Candidatus Marinamargulisbacteria bacterium SCGC AG-410-N11]